MASSKAAGRPPLRGRTEAFAGGFFSCYCCYFGGSLDLTSQEIFLHASGIHDSVDLLAALAKCIVDSYCVNFFFLIILFFPYQSSRLLEYRAPTVLLLLRCVGRRTAELLRLRGGTRCRLRPWQRGGEMPPPGSTAGEP